MGNKIIDILPREGEFYKVNLHTHSTLSDGNFTPEELKGLYRSHGYSAVAFTDHRKFIPHKELTDDKFVALTSTELDFTLKDEEGVICSVHINALSEKEDFEGEYEKMPLDYELINKTVEELKREGHFVTLNHPVWSNMTTEDVMRVNGIDAVEIYNGIGVAFNNYADDTPIYESFLRKGGRANCVSGDDCHKKFDDGTPFKEYFTSFTAVKAKELSYGAIVDALKKGNCYCSTGPEFKSLYIEGDILHVECSPVFGVYVHSKYLGAKTQDVRSGDVITHTELDIGSIRKVSPYIWIQLRDTNGNKAWSTPYYF